MSKTHSVKSKDQDEETLSETQQNELSHEERAKMKHTWGFLWEGEADDESQRDKVVEKTPARRGEHVINNNVLNVYRDIIKDFVSRMMDEHLSGILKG